MTSSDFNNLMSARNPALRPQGWEQPAPRRKARGTGKHSQAKAAWCANKPCGPVELPFPPSANRYWRTTKSGRTYVDAAAKQYKADAARIATAAGMKPLAGELAVTMIFYFPDRRGDLSNRVKVCEDALNGVGYHDDKQVSWMQTERLIDKARPRVVVDIRPLDRMIGKE